MLEFDNSSLCGVRLQQVNLAGPLAPGTRVCRRCNHLAMMHPQDRDQAGYRLTTDPHSLISVRDPSGCAVATTTSRAHARHHAWNHAHTAALRTAQLRRSGLLQASDRDGWRLLLPATPGQPKLAGTIPAVADGTYHAELEDDGPPPERFRTRRQAVRWLTQHRVVHGWPPVRWLVLEGTLILRRASSRSAAARWLTGYHSAFTGQRATQIRPLDRDTYQSTTTSRSRPTPSCEPPARPAPASTWTVAPATPTTAFP